MVEQLIEAPDLSYAHVVTIPAGSLNVHVFETGRSRNLIAATTSFPVDPDKVFEWQITHVHTLKQSIMSHYTSAQIYKTFLVRKSHSRKFRQKIEFSKKLYN